MKKIILLALCCMSVLSYAQVTLLHTFSDFRSDGEFEFITKNYTDNADVLFWDYTETLATESGAYYSYRKYDENTHVFSIKEYDSNFQEIYTKNISIPVIAGKEIADVHASKYSFNDDESWEVLVYYCDYNASDPNQYVTAKVYSENGNMIYDFGSASSINIHPSTMQHIGNTDYRFYGVFSSYDNMGDYTRCLKVFKVNKVVTQSAPEHLTPLQMPRKVIENNRVFIYVGNRRFDMGGVELH